ncbi:protein of unknown function [Acetoanaerobium sticklandii]|uniref:Uncharacterized protein n=1 Tax=Acetoanaerobium sticklandii (strain ATCC 12662 / DSM 519 / JCM 1433 / CCUG 9281 / NCIMB 10654 / HF) TaxID=499177 RepID=E3PV85_ACESD|nr:protein of unknown function [Acetoanaerobium sticklandii]
MRRGSSTGISTASIAVTFGIASTYRR